MKNTGKLVTILLSLLQARESTSRSFKSVDIPKPWASKESWEQRMWLSVEESAQERFLCSFPMFNSFSAQIVLSQVFLNCVVGFTDFVSRL
ncbi:hypothetical protein BDR26DRAFT_856150, partial [Obelidium mucronatum]